MKKIVIIAVFIFLINKTFSQKYQPVDSTTVWATNYYYKTNPYYCYEAQNLKYFSKGYELNNGNIWLKIQFSAQNYSNATPSNPNCVNSNWYSNGFLGYLFNDTINKRVFFHKGALPPNYIPLSTTSGTTELIYDSNKVVGDSMYVSSYNTYFKILSIDSILFSGKYHKRFLATISPPSGLIPKISLLEGIGSSIDPFTPYKANGFESGSALLCFASPTQSISVTSHTVFTNGNVNGSCANLSMNNVSVKETEQFDLSIYPNPASDHISVVLERNSAVGTNYKVVNLLGQEQLTGTLKETKNDIDLLGLKSGIYFINFYKNDRFVLCKKIVIQ